MQWLLSGLTTHEKCFGNTCDRILVIYEYTPFLMAMFHILKVEQSKLLHSKFVIWLADGYLTYVTSDTSWQKPVERSELVH